MYPFVLERPIDLDAAIATRAHAGRTDASSEWIAGGTDLVPLLRENVRRPRRLIDLEGLVGDRVEATPSALEIGAGATMAQVARQGQVQERFPMIVEALLASASPQVRHMATIGGNLLQRTRCAYFRDRDVAACNKRMPGTGCSALEGENRQHAVLGGSEHCIATHASDLAVALVALDAVVHTVGSGGARSLALADLYRVPAATPHLETVLEPGEIITAVVVPTSSCGQRSCYLKVRDRASFEWALVSVGLGLELEGDRIGEARIAMGGVGTRPWRMRNVEAALRGERLGSDGVRRAAAAAADGAVARSRNAFKLELMPRAILRAIELAVGRP